MEGNSSESVLRLQQQIVNAVASSTEGVHGGTVCLLELTSHPGFEWIVEWLLTGHPAFPALTLPSSRLFSRLLKSAVVSTSISPEEIAERQEQERDFAVAAQLVGFNLLLQGIEQQWESGRWTPQQKASLKRFVLATVIGDQLASIAELPSSIETERILTATLEALISPQKNRYITPLDSHTSTTTLQTTIPSSDISFTLSSSNSSNPSFSSFSSSSSSSSPSGYRVVHLQTHASRMKCAQVLTAICRYEWPQRWPSLLSVLKAKATSSFPKKSTLLSSSHHISSSSDNTATAATRAFLSGNKSERNLLSSPIEEHNTDARGNEEKEKDEEENKQRKIEEEERRLHNEGFAAACVLLGLVRELAQEAKEDCKTHLTLQRRLQLGQALAEAIDLILQTLSSVLLSYTHHQHIHHMQTLVAEVIRELAGVVDVGLLLRQQNVLLYLVQELGKEGNFRGCRLQVLQAIDLMTCSLSKKKSKRMAVEALNIHDLTVFIHCIVFLAHAATTHAANGKFDPTDAELMKRLDCVTLSLLWHMAVLPLLAHPSLKIATCGAAASIALVKRMQLAAISQPAAAQQHLVRIQQQYLLVNPSPLDISVIGVGDQQQQQQQQQLQQQQRQQYLQLLQQHALEQQEQQAFPTWFNLRSYISLLFLRCLRLGDPAVLHLITAVPAFSNLVDDIAIRLLSTAEIPAACARAAAAAAAEDTTTDTAQRLACITSPLLRTVSSLSAVHYARTIKHWYKLIVKYSAAEDDLGSEALQGFAARYASMKSTALMPLGICFSINSYAARRVTGELAVLSQLALTHPLFASRELLPDVLYRQQLEKLQQHALQEDKTEDQGCGRGGREERRGRTDMHDQLHPSLSFCALPEKQQPWVCPGYLMIDVCCSFFEALVQRLKCASLTANSISNPSSSLSISSSSSSSSGYTSLSVSPAASQTSLNTSSQNSTTAGGNSSATMGNMITTATPATTPPLPATAGGGGGNLLLSCEWMLPSEKVEENSGGGGWATDAAILFAALLELPLFSPEDAAAAIAAVDQQRIAAATGKHITTIQQNLHICLYNYLLETRRLDFISGCAYFLRYPQVNVESVLNILFTRILAESGNHDGGPSSQGNDNTAGAAWNTYPLGVEQQIYLCRRRALYTLISLCTASPGVLSRFLGMMLQHVQSRLDRYPTQDNERSLLVESLVSLISASQDFSVQQQHTLPLIRPYVVELKLVVGRLQQQDAMAFQHNAPPSLSHKKGIALLLFLFGNLRGKTSLQPSEEHQLTMQRRALARLLASLESCIKRTCIPTDPVAARKGGYIIIPSDNNSNSPSSTAASEMNAAVDANEVTNGNFGECLAKLLQSRDLNHRQQCSQQQRDSNISSETLMPRRHPLAALIKDVLPLFFELIAMLHELWNPEMAEACSPYASRLMLGEEEFQSLHGHTPLFSDPAALIEAVALTFPVEEAFTSAGDSMDPSSSLSKRQTSVISSGPLEMFNGSSINSGCTGGGGGGGVFLSETNIEEQQLSPAGRAYINSPVRLIRRHCYHLRCMLYRLVGSCCSIPDGFYMLPNLDLFLKNICIKSISFLPLHQLEQQIRLLWIPLLDPINLPPHRLYPSQQLLLFMLQEGVNGVVRRINSEWEMIAKIQRDLETSSATNAGKGHGSKEEERKLNLYTLHVYGAMSVGDTLLALLKNLLHLGKMHHGCAGGGTGTSDQTGGTTSNTVSFSGGSTAARAEEDERSGTGQRVNTFILPADMIGEKENATRQAEEEAAVAAAAAAAGHLSDIRRAIYSSPSILQNAVAALLEAQRWPNPATIIEAHSILRTYVKSATKSFTPIPTCTPEICLHILRGILRGFFEKRSFDPFSFADAHQASTYLRGAAVPPQQQLRGSTPLQEFTSGGSGIVTSSGSISNDSNVNSQVATYTATVYQVLRAFCRTLTVKTGGTEGRQLQPSSLLLCPHALAAFNFFRATELPVHLNDGDFEGFVEAVMLQDSKKGKALVKEFFQQNMAVLQQVDDQAEEPAREVYRGINSFCDANASNPGKHILRPPSC